MAAKAFATQIAFRYRTIDSPTGVTRETAKRVAERLGVDETQALHMANRPIDGQGAVAVAARRRPDKRHPTASNQASRRRGRIQAIRPLLPD